MPGAAARHAALRQLPDREAVGGGVRLAARCQGVRVAVQLLAVSPRQGWNEVSGDSADDGRLGQPRRSHARQEDGGEAAGGERGAEPCPIADRDESGTWSGKADFEADRGRDGRVVVPVLAVGRDAVRTVSRRKNNENRRTQWTRRKMKSNRSEEHT